MLLDWFHSNGRKFPWRDEIDPFKILIAEVMLQRTRAEQVVPVYLDFVKRFPDLNSLILADIHEINKFMIRLGLLWRSTLLVKMVQKISSEFDCTIPVERELLRSIPAVGDYIADAMIVFAFKRRRTVIDSNVVRVVSRFFGILPMGEVRRNRNFIIFCQTLVKGIPADQIRNFNWALIDHPASICRSKPNCQMCPLAPGCSYFQEKLNAETSRRIK